MVWYGSLERLSECHLPTKPIYLCQYLFRGGYWSKRLSLWNTMAFPSSPSSISAATQPCPVLSDTHKLPLTFIPGHCCCFGAWNSRSLPELTWRQVPLLPTQLSPLFLQVERQPCMDLSSPQYEVGGGESGHGAKFLQWLLSALCFPFGCQFSNGKYFTCHHKGERYCRVAEHCSWKLSWSKCV